MRELEMNKKGQIILEVGDKITFGTSKLKVVDNSRESCEGCYFEGIDCSDVCCSNHIMLVGEKKGGGMTVKELIHKLKGFDEESHVSVDLGYDGQGCPQTNSIISVESSGDRVVLKQGIDYVNFNLKY